MTATAGPHHPPDPLTVETVGGSVEDTFEVEHEAVDGTETFKML